MRIFTVAIFICLASATASLAHPGASGPVREACKADVDTLCQGIRPGAGRIRACLKSNNDRVSGRCKSAIAAAMQARRDVKPPSAE